MKAFVMKEIGRVGFMEKPVPQPGPGDAIVRTTRALICTSDSHTVRGGIGPRENLTLGHEAMGIVHAVDPSHMTTHEFRFDDMERAFEVADQKLDDVVEVLITF
ncbi:alcohol dehydrogenase catalytic domain-containing protein [Microtetraspora malaysiensis]|uniref:alcohol dehydrogenase catalytic domain-containing protein n=1 Tax=Microtetraspora malaysiensis TaxID=161358 RepID=UPI003D9148A7